ncbi:MAG: hypothetical protein IJV22_05280 [Bacteroidales bacterium]|nr:hypothetical protein [Bacteroidales bacterium]
MLRNQRAPPQPVNLSPCRTALASSPVRHAAPFRTAYGLQPYDQWGEITTHRSGQQGNGSVHSDR